MNILYIAYSCSPYYGSEDKIGWNVPLECAKTNQVFVITKEEHRADIESFLAKEPLNNISFSFVDIPAVYKKLFKGFLYSGRLNIWHRRAYRVARRICKEQNVQIIHQITPIEFRSIGNYGKIPATKFVCGPLGGGEFLPEGLADYARGNEFPERIRKIANGLARFLCKTTGKLQNCDYVMFANRETKAYLSDVVSGQNEIYFDNGLRKEEIRSQQMRDRKENGCVFLAAGRMIYRKGYAFLLDALERVPEDLEYTCRIVGDGPELRMLRQRCAQSPNLTKHVVLTGAVQYDQMQKEYAQADVFVMPSIRETTGSVLLEAASNGLPVVTINKFGGGSLLDKDTGWLYDGSNRESFIESLKDALVECIQNPEENIRRGNNFRKKAECYTWDNKNAHYQDVYCRLKK